MAKFLIDANLPYYFSIWHGSEYIHQFDLGDEWPDIKIWKYAKAKNLTIVTKDADFSSRIINQAPPPKVIHLKIGNMKLQELYSFIDNNWDVITKLSKKHKLLTVFQDRIETIGV
jgi:predicted nuclease of predicted toxin-antitoxin system